MKMKMKKWFENENEISFWKHFENAAAELEIKGCTLIEKTTK